MLYFANGVKNGDVRNIECNEVISIYDENGNKTDFDCAQDTFYPEQ